MISDKIEQAQLNPEKDYHLNMDIRRVLRFIESDQYHSEVVDAELEELSSDHPIYRLIDSFAVWEESGHQEFESGMNSALEALDDLYESAL